MDEVLDYLSEEYKKDYIELINQIEYIKQKKNIPPHIIEFEGNKIPLYDELMKFTIRRMNDNRTWWERIIKKVVYDASNTSLYIKNLIGLDAFSNVLVYRRVNRGQNAIRVVFIGSYMELKDSIGRVERTNATELDYVYKIS